MAIANASKTLRVFSHLLDYPSHDVRTHLAELQTALRDEGAIGGTRLAEIDSLLQWIANTAPLDVEADYVAVFDRGRSTSLHLFEHIHGDSRDRGPAMIDLTQTYEKAGLYLAEGELPDFLPALLQFVSTQPPREARSFLAEMAEILNALFSALKLRQSPYASVIGALIELAGETAQAVALAPEAPLDEAWSEPVAFDGCSTQGQARPGQPQPIHMIKKPSRRTNADQGAVA
jgi:nitrate reductase delta subunit